METGLIIFLITTLSIMSLGLLYLIYNIVKSKLLFKSALKSSYKSIFALVSLILLYTITFSLWNSNIMFQNKLISSTDNLVAETNFHQVTIDTDEHQELPLTNALINQDKWVTELGPTMDDMYPSSQPFDDWSDVENIIAGKNQDNQLPTLNGDATNTLYFTEFLDIWMFQNEKYKGGNGQTLPYINFGYNELATLELVIPPEEEGGEELNVLAFRMNPLYDPIDNPTDKGVARPVPEIGDYKDEVPNELLLKEGELPNANDASDGTSEDEEVEIAILRMFGESQNYPIGSKIHAKPESDDFAGTTIEHSNFHGIVTGYIEHSSLTFFDASSSSIMPDFSKQTIMAIPFDAFNKMADDISGIITPKFEINITFAEDMQYLKDGGSLQDFGSTWDNNNQEDFIKAISSYFKKWTELEFYGELSNTHEQNETALFHSMAKNWNNFDNEYSTGITMTFEMSETNKLISGIINSIFLGINIIFIFMVLKRKVMSQSKQIGVFKSLGYNSREISSSFVVNVFIIVIFGGFLSIILSFPLTIWLEEMFISTSLGMEMLATQLTTLVFLISIVIPFILISLVVWFFINLILRKPPTALLNDTTANKPNALVRGSSVITRHLSFTNAYATKNGIRAMGKSFVTFSSIFFSTTLLLFGILVSGFAEKATDSTFGLMNYEAHGYEEQRVATLDKDEIDDYGNDYDDPLNEYTFGVNFDYDTYDESTNPNAYQSDPSDPTTNVWDEVFSDGYQSNDLTDRFNAWQQEILYYMKTTEISRDKTYIDISQPGFIHSGLNTASLFNDLNESTSEVENDLISQDLEFKVKTAPSGTLETETYKNLSLQDMFLKMKMFVYSSLDMETFETKKIIFDVYEMAEEESSHLSTSLYISQINGVNQLDNSFEELEEIKLYSGEPETFENSTFNLNSWHRNDDLNKTILEYENNDPNILPVIIDYPTAQLLRIEVGDTLEMVHIHMMNFNDNEVIPLEVKVIGIYETYMPISWFSLNTEPALIKYLEIYDAQELQEPDNSNMWYESTDVFGVEGLEDELFKHESELSPKTYSCMGSESFYEETFFLVNNDISKGNPITSMEPCFAFEIPKEYFVAISTEGTNMMNQMLGIFVGFAYMIVFIILLVISNETIQGSKREVSTLKALGYKTRTMSKIVLLGQAGVMIISIFIALPFTVLVMNMITFLILTEAGAFFDLTPVFADIAIVIGVVLIIVVLMYVLGVIIYQKTSPLDSLQRD